MRPGRRSGQALAATRGQRPAGCRRQQALKARALQMAGRLTGGGLAAQLPDDLAGGLPDCGRDRAQGPTAGGVADPMNLRNSLCSRRQDA